VLTQISSKATRIRMVRIGPLSGGNGCGVDRSGTVAGSWSNALRHRLFFWLLTLWRVTRSARFVFFARNGHPAYVKECVTSGRRGSRDQPSIFLGSRSQTSSWLLNHFVYSPSAKLGAVISPSQKCRRTSPEPGFHSPDRWMQGSDTEQSFATTHSRRQKVCKLANSRQSRCVTWRCGIGARANPPQHRIPEIRGGGGYPKPNRPGAPPTERTGPIVDTSIDLPRSHSPGLPSS
jgi:hypothetical protein